MDESRDKTPREEKAHDSVQDETRRTHSAWVWRRSLHGRRTALALGYNGRLLSPRCALVIGGHRRRMRHEPTLHRPLCPNGDMCRPWWQSLWCTWSDSRGRGQTRGMPPGLGSTVHFSYRDPNKQENVLSVWVNATEMTSSSLTSCPSVSLGSHGYGGATLVSTLLSPEASN